MQYTYMNIQKNKKKKVLRKMEGKNSWENVENFLLNNLEYRSVFTCSAVSPGSYSGKQSALWKY